MSNYTVFRNINYLLSTLCFLLFSICYFFISKIFILYFFLYLLSVFFIYFNSNKSSIFIYTNIIFSSAILFASILGGANAYYLYAFDVEPYLYSDQITFYNVGSELARTSDGIFEIISNISENPLLLNYPLAYFFFAIFCYFEFCFVGSICFFSQLFPVIFLFSYTILILFLIFREYCQIKTSFTASMKFALLLPMASFSGYLLRDIHIALLTMLSTLIIIRKFSYLNLSFLIFLILGVAGFRVQNSFIIIAMLFYYLLTNFKMNFSKSLLLFVLIFLISSKYSNFLIDAVRFSEVKLAGYSAFTEANEPSGFSRIIYSLPSPFKEILIMIFGLSTFPFYNVGYFKFTWPSLLMEVISVVTNLHWFAVFICIILFGRRFLTFFRDRGNRIFGFLFVLFLLYAFFNTVNFTFRRFIPYLHFLYIPYIILFTSTGIRISSDLKMRATSIVVMIFLFYIGFKYF
jgi:hypothetical protein